MARPKITTDDFPENWENGIIELASQGASDVEIRDYLNGICHETWARLIEEDKEFSETVKKARLKCQVWWEKKGRLNLDEKDFSATLWYMNMKNRFGWADKQEVKQETFRITWPTKKDTMMGAIMVFALASIAAIFFLILDQILRFLLNLVLTINF